MERSKLRLRPETTDEQLLLLGEGTCETAQEETSFTWNQAVESQAQQAVTDRSLDSDNSTSLTEADYKTVLTGSLLVYCPEEAARLEVDG